MTRCGADLSREHIGRMLEVDGAQQSVRLDDAYGSRGDPEGRLLRLAERFALTQLDVHILLAALAPDVDRASSRCTDISTTMSDVGVPPSRSPSISWDWHRVRRPLVPGSILVLLCARVT
ncbi:hypothetical protein E4K10_42240 [Streptomyces sp. T1317-0309]|nr:hypothetical protein E4K10_42240 [Streptomyces sp. T1317-0309]